MKQLIVFWLFITMLSAYAQETMRDKDDIPGNMGVCIYDYGPTITAAQAELDQHANSISNNAAGVATNAVNFVNVQTQTTANSVTGAVNTAAIGVLQTARVERVWSSTTNYMDGAGIYYEIVTTDLVDFVFPTGGTIGPFLCPDPTTWTYTAPTSTSEIEYTLNGDWHLWLWPGGGPHTAKVMHNMKTTYNARESSVLGENTFLYPYDNALHQWVDGVEDGDPDNTIAVNWRTLVTTNIIDRTVTTNGTVIIIGSTADTSGSTTSLQAKLGSSTIDIPFYGREEADAIATSYVLTDGSRAFTAPVSGVTPTADTHLATKGYVDTSVSDIDLTPYALKSNVLGLDNTTVYTPNADYQPATKKYVDDNSGGISYWNRVGTTLSPATAGDDVDIEGDFTVDNGVLFVSPDGNNVGIGTIDPVANARLHIVSDTSLGDPPWQGYFERVANSAAAPATIMGYRARGTIASRSSLQNNDAIFSFQCGGYNGTAYKTPGIIRFFVDGTVTDTKVPGRIEFWLTRDSDGSLSEKMTIFNNGDVSIDGDVTSGGTIQGAYKSSDGTPGWTGTFVNGGGNTVTVKDGLITAVTAP